MRSDRLAVSVHDIRCILGQLLTAQQRRSFADELWFVAG